MSNLGTTDFGLEIAKGNVANHSAINKFGENPDIDTGSTDTIWDGGGVYVPPTVARVHNVASSLAGDTGLVLSSGTADSALFGSRLNDQSADFVSDGVQPGDNVLNDSAISIGFVSAVTANELTILGGMRDPGSGAQVDENQPGESYRVVTANSTGASLVHIQGLDTNFATLNEFVVLNGVTNVATSGSYLRQFRIRSFGKSAVGDITSTAVTDGTVSCQIINGNNQSLMAVYTVPVGKIGYITSAYIGVGKTNTALITATLRSGGIDTIGFVQHRRELDTGATSDITYKPDVPIAVAGGLDIWWEASTSANNTTAVAGFDVVLVDV